MISLLAQGHALCDPSPRVGDGRESLDVSSTRVTELGAKLGPIVWQFAPFLPFDEANFAAFLELLPKRAGNLKLRHVLEVRHKSSPTRPSSR